MDNTGDVRRKAGAFRNPKLISVMVLIALVVILILQNRQVVALKIYFWEIAMSQIILIPLVLLVGFLAGYLVARFTGKQRRKEKTKPAA